METEVDSGLCWGELTELRVRDLDFATRMLTVSRAVVQVHPKLHPDPCTSDLHKLVGDTGIEPVTSSVSRRSCVRFSSWPEVLSAI